MYNNFLDTFKKLNDKEIKYFVLRDYKKIKDIDDSLDIDIYVDKKQKNIVHKLLLEEGWYTPLFNDTKYPHKQYYKMYVNRIYKLDIVYDFYYGKRNYHFKQNEDLKTEKIEYINIPTNDFAIYSMILHIVFDKGMINNKNYDILKYMLDSYNKSNNSISKYPFIINIAQEIVSNNIDTTNKKISKYKNIILKSKILKYNPILNMIFSIKRIFNYYVKRVFKLLHNRSIAFIGVDGSGKSSNIQKIKSIYGDRAEIVYMGLKEFDNKKLTNYLKKEEKSFIKKLDRRYLLYKEMLKRTIKNRFKNKIVLYDRYADDIFINSYGALKIIDKIFYKYLFPRPKLKIYFYCDIDESLKRKDDITDKEKFEKMKNRYDAYYLNKKKIFVINTKKNNELMTLNKIIEIINKYLKDSLEY